MRLALAIFTLGVGAAVAATSVWMPPSSSVDDFAVVTDVAAGGVAVVSVPGRRLPPDTGTSTPRFFGTGLNAPVPTATQVVEAPVPMPAPASWNTVVLPEPKQAVRPVAHVVTGSIAAPRDLPRQELVRDIQRELKRVGCYAGDVDGDWGAGSKRAVRSFMDRVNSSLPTEAPDMIQLTLVRGYSGIACSNGAVVAAPLTAKSNRPTDERPLAIRQPQGATSISTAPVAPAPATSASVSASVVVPLEGRMAMGGPPVPTGTEIQAPAVSAVPPPVAKPRSQHASDRPQTSARRKSDRAWTGNFFN